MLSRTVRSVATAVQASSKRAAAPLAPFSSKSRAAIDVHTHLYYSRYIDMLRTRKVAPRVIERDGKPRLIILPSEEDTKEKAISAGRVIDSNYWEFSQKLKFMDKHDIEISVVSLANPWLDFLSPQEARPLATALNEDLQSAAEKSGGRFYGFGVLPTHDLDGCVAEVERISKLSKLRGLIMGTAGLGKGLDDPALDKLWAKVEALGLVIFLHPHYGVGNELYGGYGHTLFLACGFTFETTVAVSRMVLSGVFDRFPKLKMLLAHSGGTLPFLAGRLDACTLDDPAMAGRLKKAPSEYLKNLYFDSITYASPSVDCTTKFVGMDKVMFGTDCPFSISDPQTNYRAMEHLSSADQRAICRDNAKRLLNLP